MMIKKISTVILAVLLVTMVGCRTSPIKNVSDAPIAASGKYTAKDVKNGIIRAGIGLGWKMKEMKKGHILGTLHIRDHMAKVDIAYTKKSYSITYKDSSALQYDGESIHKNYNGWITNLERSINANLSSF